MLTNIEPLVNRDSNLESAQNEEYEADEFEKEDLVEMAEPTSQTKQKSQRVPSPSRQQKLRNASKNKPTIGPAAEQLA